MLFLTWVDLLWQLSKSTNEPTINGTMAYENLLAHLVSKKEVHGKCECFLHNGVSSQLRL